MNATIWWRKFIRLLQDIELEELFQNVSRYPKRKLLIIVCAIIFVIYYLGISTGSGSVSPAAKCVMERFKNWDAAVQDMSIGIDENVVKFAGNGHIGIDVDEELRLSSNGSKILDFATGFKPLVHLNVVGGGSSAESIFTEFIIGRVRNIKCFAIDGDCMCVFRTHYVHRTRKELIVEEVKVVNPTTFAEIGSNCANYSTRAYRLDSEQNRRLLFARRKKFHTRCPLNLPDDGVRLLAFLIDFCSMLLDLGLLGANTQYSPRTKARRSVSGCFVKLCIPAT